MPVRSEYQQGEFCWVDLMAHDMAAAKEFYGKLFGWAVFDADTRGGPPYAMFLNDGGMVAGLGETPAEMRSAGAPPTWNSYIAVDDVQATTARAADLDGTVAMPPMQILSAGSMAVLQDPTGAFVFLWQKDEHAGAQRIGDPGTVCWNELATRDIAKARAFYGGLVGWEFAPHEGTPTEYSIIKVADRDGGGLMQMNEMWGDMPSHWMVYFAVEDIDASCEQLKQLGGTVHMPPFAISVGRIAVVADPQGAVFSLIQLAGE